MWFLRTRQAGKADRHYTAPCPGEKIKAIQATHAPTPLRQARESGGGVRQSSGVSRRLGDAGGDKGSGARWKKLEIFVLCHRKGNLNWMNLVGVDASFTCVEGQVNEDTGETTW